MSYEQQATYIIDEAVIMALSSIASDGRPWTVIVHKKSYENGVLSWSSKPTSDHSQYITHTPQVALALWNDNEIVSIQATAYEVEQDEHGFATYAAAITNIKYCGADTRQHWLDVQQLAAVS